MTDHPTLNAISLHKASLKLGSHWIWQDLSLEVQPGEFVAVLGPNGSGKTSLLKVLLGLVSLSAGKVLLSGRPPGKGNSEIGYIPQQKSFDPNLPIRGVDLVQFGANGTKWGIGFGVDTRVHHLLQQVGADNYADKPIGQLSGGEQQRLRIAQALISQPRLLLCDEPLLSLDLAQQQAVSGLIAEQSQQQKVAVLFVTHDINPILTAVDRVLYFAHGRWLIGSPKEVLTSKALSDLYQSPIEVLEVKGRIIVLGADDLLHTDPEAHHMHYLHHHHHHD